MKLKKLLSLDFMKDLESLLETDFEKQLYVASLRNYASHSNPLRFHNFAFSMRELVLHVIKRKAPLKQVKKATWYEVESTVHPVTRRQQLKYCAQRNISDEYLKDALDILDESIAEFLSEFRFFNKYTHITEKYFTACPKQFFQDAKYVVGLAVNSLSQLEDIERIVIDAMESKAHDTVISTAVSAIPDSLSILANHAYIDYTEVEEIECLSIDDRYIRMRAKGNVYVTQEYGPKNDICTMEESYPFTLDMKSHVENPEDFTVEAEELSVDTSEWYGDI